MEVVQQVGHQLSPFGISECLSASAGNSALKRPVLQLRSFLVVLLVLILSDFSSLCV